MKTNNIIIPEELQKVFDDMNDNDVHISDPYKDDNKYYFEAEFYSKLGEDVVITIQTDNLTKESFLNALNKTTKSITPPKPSGFGRGL